MRALKVPTGLKEFLKFVEPFKRFSQRLDRGTVDMSKPSTEVESFKASLEKAAEGIDSDELASGLIDIINEISAHGVAAAFRSPQRPRGSMAGELCEYLSEVERDLPFAVTMVYGASQFSQFENLENLIKLGGKAQSAMTSRGERRADSVMLYAEAVLEIMYKEMITVFYELECLRRNGTIPSRPKFGNMVSSVAAWTKAVLPGFIDVDAARIRNAAAHHHWRYDPKTKLMHLYDETKWRASMTATQIYQRSRGHLRAVSTMMSALQWCAADTSLRLFSTPPLSRLFDPGVLTSPPPDLEAANRTAIDAAFAPFHSRATTVGWRPRWPSITSSASAPSPSP